MRVCPKAAFPRTTLMFLNGLCRQPELQISKSDTCSPEILSFLHLNAKRSGKKNLGGKSVIHAVAWEEW